MSSSATVILCCVWADLSCPSATSSSSVMGQDRKGPGHEVSGGKAVWLPGQLAQYLFFWCPITQRWVAVPVLGAPVQWVLCNLVFSLLQNPHWGNGGPGRRLPWLPLTAALWLRRWWGCSALCTRSPSGTASSTNTLTPSSAPSHTAALGRLQKGCVPGFQLRAGVLAVKLSFKHEAFLFHVYLRSFWWK